MAQPNGVPFARRLEDARRVHARGDAATAAHLLIGLNAERPDTPAVLHALGVALAQTGRLAEAETPLLRAVRLEPRTADIRFDLAALRDAQGRPGEAEKVLRELVTVVPDHARAWSAIGMYSQDRQDYPAAAEAYANAYRVHPESIEYALKAAELLPPEEGATILAECLRRFPQEDALLQPLAELLIRADRWDDAETILRHLGERQPKSGLARRHLGFTYSRMQRYPEAAAALYEALLLDPQDAEAWVALANVRDALGDDDGSAAAMGRATDLRPNDLPLLARHMIFLRNAALGDQVQNILGSLPAGPRAAADARLLSGMLMPPIADSNEAIDAARERWMETMADVEARPTFIPEPWETVPVTGFGLGYHGREDRLPMEAFARATLAASPHLDYTAPQLGGSGERKLRVGFLSAHMRMHSVGRVLVKLMGALDRERFDVVLFQLPDKLGGGQEWGEANADRTVRLVKQLDAARAAVEAEHVDALIFCDLHLDPFTDALSYSRLAPVQATTWGHPGTSGRASIDYWLSCQDWEPVGNERLYTEGLVRLALPPFVYTRPMPPLEPRDRASFGLRKDARLYGSLQSLFKFHPDMDAIFASILDRDPKGRIVLIEGGHYVYRKALRTRFARSFDPDRIDFIPKVHNADYLSAVAACDVMIDPIHFAGANTSLEAFALGKPVVTLRGDQMRNRATGGFYRHMGYEKLVADDHEAYVDLVLSLAQDRRFYREAKEAILESNGVLFENLAPVKGLEDWLLSVRS